MAMGAWGDIRGEHLFSERWNATPGGQPLKGGKKKEAIPPGGLSGRQFHISLEFDRYRRYGKARGASDE